MIMIKVTDEINPSIPCGGCWGGGRYAEKFVCLKETLCFNCEVIKCNYINRHSINQVLDAVEKISPVDEEYNDVCINVSLYSFIATMRKILNKPFKEG